MSALARALVVMTPGELQAFVLGVLAASPRVSDETITKLACSYCGNPEHGGCDR